MAEIKREVRPVEVSYLCDECNQGMLVQSGPMDPDTGDIEHIHVTLMSEVEVRAAVQDGTLRHALALSALARVFDLWPRPFVQDPMERRPAG